MKLTTTPFVSLNGVIFAGAWRAMADPGINPIGEALNTRPKYGLADVRPLSRTGRA